jgi:very-short-patch-repair endonuclease
MANERARALRKSMSDAEWTLWQGLRGGQLDGYKFRRQHPMDRFILDFVCLEKRLVIEVDGAQHAEPDQAAHDAARTRWLAQRGYRVLRFWTNEIMTEGEAVLEAIWAELQDMPAVRNRPIPPRRAKLE